MATMAAGSDVTQTTMTTWGQDFTTITMATWGQDFTTITIPCSRLRARRLTDMAANGTTHEGAASKRKMKKKKGTVDDLTNWICLKTKHMIVRILDQNIDLTVL